MSQQLVLRRIDVGGTDGDLVGEVVDECAVGRLEHRYTIGLLCIGAIAFTVIGSELNMNVDSRFEV